MGLIKHRPKIRLLLPRLAFPGESATGTVVLEARREVRVEKVRVELSGVERSKVGSDKNATHSSRRLVDLAAELSRARTLAPGATRYDFELPLPDGLPASFKGRRASVEYTLRVEAPIKWWPDARADFVLQVGSTPVASRPPTPRLYASDPAGPRGRERHLECSLADDAVYPGQPLQGSIALYNVAHHRYRLLQLSLVAQEQAFTKHRRRASSEQSERHAISFPLKSPVEGQAIPFALLLPERARPSAKSELWDYTWTLEVRVEIPWARDLVLTVPVTVLAVGSRASRAVTAPPVVGSERVQAIWRSVGEEHGLRFDGERLSGELEQVAITIACEHRGAGGNYVVGDLRWPTLGLALDGGRRSGLRRIFHGGDVSLGDPAWDKEHYLAGREAAQVRAFGEALRPALVALAGLDDLDDESLRAERRASGQNRSVLGELAGGLLRLAGSLGAARAAIPPPALMREAAPGWQALARELNAPLETARMAVVGGTIGGVPAEIVTDWGIDGVPQKTRLSVTPTLAIAAERQLEWPAGPTAERALPATGALPSNAAVLVQDLADEVRTIAIRGERIEAALDAPLLDPAPILPLLRKLATLASLLAPSGGPYR